MGAPVRAQRVKNRTAAAQVSAEVRFQAPAQCRGLRSGIATAAPQVAGAVQIQSLAQELPHATGAAERIK